MNDTKEYNRPNWFLGAGIVICFSAYIIETIPDHEQRIYNIPKYEVLCQNFIWNHNFAIIIMRQSIPKRNPTPFLTLY
jgi:hypothetical protein